MKRYFIALFLILATAPLFSMETDLNNEDHGYKQAPLETYPIGMGYIPENEILTNESVVANFVPEYEQREAKEYLKKHPEIAKFCSLRQEQVNSELATEKITRQNNWITITVAGPKNALYTNLSSIGFDPTARPEPPQITRAFGLKFPRFQHLSNLVTQALIKRTNSKTIVPVKTWPCHLKGNTTEASDQNYIIVQEKMGSQYKPFSRLDKKEKHQVLKDLDLAEVYRVLKYANLWHPIEDNLWINSEKPTAIAYPNGEKPPNEGSGIQAKWKIAVFGQDSKKAKSNIKSGHTIIKEILERYCADRSKEWKRYYKKDIDVQ